WAGPTSASTAPRRNAWPTSKRCGPTCGPRASASGWRDRPDSPRPDSPPLLPPLSTSRDVAVLWHRKLARSRWGGVRLMEFGMFFELQLPRPWGPEDEQVLFRNALEWAE